MLDEHAKLFSKAFDVERLNDVFGVKTSVTFSLFLVV